MIRLRTLGALDLRLEDGTEVQSVLRQPKRFALLAYLALARPRGFQRRDRVLLTFWPELDRDRARGALNQSVFILRSGLGREIVVNRGDEEIGIGPDQLWCDAVAFDEAFERGDFEAALSLYQGELLAGFHVDDAADFERWLDEERAQRAQRAAEAAWTLAENAGNAGDVAAARDWASKAISFGPWDERGLRRLMALLDQAGDRAAAIAAFNDFAKRLRADLEIDPSAETLELAETIKARAEPNGGPEPEPLLSAPAVPEPLTAPTPASARERRSVPSDVIPAGTRTGVAVRRIIRELRWTTAVLVAVVGALVAFMVVAPDPEGPVRVAVMPVRDESPNRQYRHITGALTTTIIQLMHHPGSLQVVSQLDVRAYEDSTPTHDEIARRFDVDYIVSGSLTGSGDRIKVTLELIDSEDGEVIDGAVMDKADSDWLAFSEEMGKELATLLRTRLGREYREQQWKAGTTRDEAWEALAKANELFSLGQSIEEHPPEHAMKLFREAASFAETAQREDPGWHEPYLMLARIMEWRAFLSSFDAGVPEAVRNAMFDSALAYAEKALRQDRGGKAASLEMRGTIRYRRYSVASPPGDSGRVLLDLAERDLREALRVDDGRARAASTLFYINYNRGRLQEAKTYATQALANDAYLEEIANTVNNLFIAAFHLGEDKDASFWCEQVADYMPDTYPVAVCRLMLLSWGEDAPPDAKNALLQMTSAVGEEPTERRPSFEPVLMALTVPAVRRDSTYGGADSARALLDRARALQGEAQSPMFEEFEAAALVALEDYNAAFTELVEIVRKQPLQLARLKNSRFFQPLYARGEAYALTRAVVLPASAGR